MNPVVKEIQQRLKGKTQAALAKELGLSVSYLNSLLVGKASVSKRVGALFGYELTWRKVK